MGGFEVVPDNLRAASRDVSTAAAGADDLALDTVVGKSGEAFGHDAVHTAIASFCTTWDLAVGVLQGNAEAAADALGRAADVYETRDKDSVMPASATGEQEVV